jgi:hypothetical protein
MIWSITEPGDRGDGDLMEGINHEAVGLAGHSARPAERLWDDNKITIDGATDSAPPRHSARYRRQRLARGRLRRSMTFGQHSGGA